MPEAVTHYLASLCLQLATMYRRKEIKAGTIERISKALVGDVVETVLSKQLSTVPLAACHVEAAGEFAAHALLVTPPRRLRAHDQGVGGQGVREGAASVDP